MDIVDVKRLNKRTRETLRIEGVPGKRQSTDKTLEQRLCSIIERGSLDEKNSEK